MAPYREQYYTLEEAEIQKLIAKAKEGDGYAQNELLKVFNNFLTKYVTLLYYGKYNLGDYDIRRFAGLFIKDPFVRKFLMRNKLNEQGYKLVAEALRGVQYMCQRYGDETDIRQTVSMTFLQCVQRYKPAPSKLKEGEVVPFKGFIYSYYFYLLKKNVDAFLIDQLGRKTFPLISDDDMTGDEEGEPIQGFTAPPEPSVEELIGAEEIDQFWVLGDTAMWPFDRLGVQERQLLKWRYVDGLKSSEISEKISEHSNTCRERLGKIRNKIEEIMQEDLI